MAKFLTEDQAREIAHKVDEGRNPYDVAKQVLGRKLADDEADALLDDLLELAGVFKCVSCNVWHDKSEEGRSRDRRLVRGLRQDRVWRGR